MERTIVFLVLCTAVEGDIGKHVFVPTSMIWYNAQTYCRQHYTDLSFVGSQSDIDRLPKTAGANYCKGWIGLYRDLSNITGWKWSGGGYTTYQNWAQNQPDNCENKEVVVQLFADGKWNDNQETVSLPFYCISITVVEVKKSWEEALELCRENQTDLTSLNSETESLLAWEEIQKVTERVWLGLRFLGGRWLWVNGDPLVYEAWSQGGNHLCPINKRCGSLTEGGLWENWDCQDKLNFICF